jgi:hypothetical protein
LWHRQANGQRAARFGARVGARHAKTPRRARTQLLPTFTLLALHPAA